MAPGTRGVHEELAANVRTHRRQRGDDVLEVAQPATVLQAQQRRLDGVKELVGTAWRARPLGQLLDENLRRPDDVLRQVVALGEAGVPREQRDEMKGQILLRQEQVVRPAGDSSRHVGVGPFENQADVGAPHRPLTIRRPPTAWPSRAPRAAARRRATDPARGWRRSGAAHRSGRARTALPCRRGAIRAARTRRRRAAPATVPHRRNRQPAAAGVLSPARAAGSFPTSCR